MAKQGSNFSRFAARLTRAARKTLEEKLGKAVDRDVESAAVQKNFDQAVDLHRKGQLARAQALYQQVVKAQPGHFDALHLLGVIAYQDKDPEEAVELIEKAIQINPDNPESYSNRGLALHDLGRWNEALASYEQAINLKPTFAKAYYNSGTTLQVLKRMDEALACYDNAIRLKPDYADAHLQKAFCRLQLGDFARGWEGYEWRWKCESFSSFHRSFKQPLWLGKESLSGKTILLYSEQGFGDTLQFCRYAQLVCNLGARVILEVDQALAGLLSTLEGVSEIIVKGRELPMFDYHCPLLSLPLALKTDLSNVPAGNGYLASDPGKLTKWRAKLGEPGKSCVGLVWSGSATHFNDRNRSIAFADLVRCLPEQYQYISLQKEVRDRDRDAMQSRADILHFDGELNDFAETAALCALMDVVVSVDTSVAHLAGALGKPVFILLPFNQEWRWMLDREDSPWYSSARLFRQEKFSDWGVCMKRVSQALCERLTVTISGGPQRW